jgi:2-dehydro-3-deoxyphosphogluconate aldolase / (4S)-4-hydroxy-2-oxoglutarate aldolase
MKKEEIRQQIIDIGIVPVLRVSSPKLAMAAAEAVLAGGIPIVEVTMTIPKAVDVIRELAMSMSSDVIVGAGTVLDAQAAQQCLDSGAQFLVSPVFDLETIKLANSAGKLMMAGALTPTEIVTAWSRGSDFVKVFPCGNVGGPKYIQTLRGPLPHIPLIPTGGVSLDTAAAFITAGASALGVGTELISESELKAGNPMHITRTAKRFVTIVQEARQTGQLVTP